MTKVASGKEKTGIIDEITDGKPHFIQRTFAEYFAAQWFSQNYRGNQKILVEIMFSQCYNVVKNIFNRIISNKKVLDSVVLNNDIIGVQNALHNCEDVNE
jgi:hypothetical protein